MVVKFRTRHIRTKYRLPSERKPTVGLRFVSDDEATTTVRLRSIAFDDRNER